MKERLFTPYEVAKLLGQTPGTIVAWIQEGALPVRDFPDGPARIPEQGLNEFIRRRGQEAMKALPQTEPAEPARQPADEIEALQRLADELPAAEAEAPREAEALMEQGPLGEAELPQAAPKEPAEAGRAVSAESQIADAILADAAEAEADQIHLEPLGEGLRLRTRAGGVLREKPNFAARLPAELAPKLIDHLKSLANVDVNERRRPQGGTFSRIFDGREIQVQLSTCPTAAGEKVFLRLADAARAAGLSQLGLDEADELRLRDILAAGGGMIIIAGPPRKDRSAAVDALAREAVRADRNVAAASRGPRDEIDGVNQTWIDPAAGLTYAEAVRTFEMQDADVIAIDDLRDPPTALAAMEAARDGRTIIAGMIAADAAAAVAALVEMGLEPWPLSQTLSAIIEQRRARCAVTYVDASVAAAIRAGKFT